jgi:hypothetical protein
MVPNLSLASPIQFDGRPERLDKTGIHPSSLRVNHGGNFCGHNPESPSFINYLPKHDGKGSLPRILTKLCESVAGLYDDPDLLPSFAHSLFRLRRMRTEQRDACVSMLLVMLQNTDLETLRVGNPKHRSGGFVSYTVAYLSKKAGLSFRRGQRAMRSLVDAGIVTVYQQRTVSENGEYQSQAAVKTIHRAIFRAFGLERMYKHFLNFVSKKKKKTSDDKKNASSYSWYQREQDDRSRAHLELMIPKISKGFKRKQKKTKAEGLNLNETQLYKYRQAQIDIAIENPQISPDELQKLAIAKAKL